jgi:hypothetical protein
MRSNGSGSSWCVRTWNATSKLAGKMVDEEVMTLIDEKVLFLKQFIEPKVCSLFFHSKTTLPPHIR